MMPADRGFGDAGLVLVTKIIFTGAGFLKNLTLCQVNAMRLNCLP